MGTQRSSVSRPPLHVLCHRLFFDVVCMLELQLTSLLFERGDGWIGAFNGSVRAELLVSSRDTG